MAGRILICCFFLMLKAVSLRASEAALPEFAGITRLSDQAQVSVITCGTGEEIYSLFGHTALRIHDPVYRIDRVYNYGTFQFNTPHFYLKFAGGKLAYYLSESSYLAFEASYRAENRSLSEQILNLNPEEVRKVYQSLEENLMPENRFYYYQFFSDNCTTRVYDLLKEALGDKLQTDTTYIAEQLSFRQLIYPYIEGHPWVRIGMNVALGLEADQKTALSERLFLPAELEKALDNSMNGSGELVKEKKTLFTPRESSIKEAAVSFSPLLLFSNLALLVLILSFFEYRRGAYYYWLDVFVFGITGVVGVILLLLWLFSAHTPTHQNLNLLWLNPLNLLMLIPGSRVNQLKQEYALAGILLLSALVLFNIFILGFVPEFYPVAVILIVRFYLHRRNTNPVIFAW